MYETVLSSLFKSLIGSRVLLEIIFAPIEDKGLMTLSIGLFESEESPTNIASIPLPANRPNIKRSVVPEFPQFNSSLGLINSELFTQILELDIIILAPHFSKQSIVDSTS